MPLVDCLVAASTDYPACAACFIAKNNPLAAIAQDAEIERQVDVLINHPELGRLGRVEGTRELVISHTLFIAVYRINAQRVEILRVLHSAQMWPVE